MPSNPNPWYNKLLEEMQNNPTAHVYIKLDDLDLEGEGPLGPFFEITSVTTHAENETVVILIEISGDPERAIEEEE